MKPATETLRLTPTQLATMLIFEAQIASLQTAANQLAFVKCDDEAKAIVKAANGLIEFYTAAKREWATGIVVATANSVIPSLGLRP